MTKDEVKILIQKNKGGKINGIYGPTKMANMMVWEIWTFAGIEHFTRIVVERPGKEPIYFSDFHQFCGLIDTEINDNHIRKWTFYVAGAAFILVLMTMLYLSVTNSSAQIITALLGILASGAAFFFGRWIPFSKPVPPAT